MGTAEPNGGAGNGGAGQGFLRRMVSIESEQAEFEEKVFLAEEGINLEAVCTAVGLEVRLPMLGRKCG